MLHHGSVGRVLGKEWYFCVYMYYFGIFLFFIKKFIIFTSFFRPSIKFPRQNPELETGIGDKILSMEYLFWLSPLYFFDFDFPCV